MVSFKSFWKHTNKRVWDFFTSKFSQVKLVVIFTFPVSLPVCVCVGRDSPPQFSCAPRTPRNPAGCAKDARSWPLFTQALSQGMYATSNHREELASPSGQTVVLFTAYYKTADPPSSIFLRCDVAHCICRLPSRPWHHMGLWGKWGWCQHADAHPACQAMRNEVLCL